MAARSEAGGRVRVRRHSLLFRIVHWLMVAEGAILGVTGISLSEALNMEIISRGTARQLHEVTGLAFAATALFFIYLFVMDGEYRWYGLRRIPAGFDFFFAEVRAWFTGRHVSEPIRYDEDRGDYVEKVVPTEVLAWWLWFLLGAGIIVTGLALMFPEPLAQVHRLCAAVIPDNLQVQGAAALVIGTREAVATRAAHFLLAAAVLVVLIVHAYAGWVYGMLRSIVFGYRDEPSA